MSEEFKHQPPIEFIDNKLKNPPSIKPQTGTNSFNFFRDLDPLGTGGGPGKRTTDLMKKSVEMTFKTGGSNNSNNMSGVKGIIMGSQ